MLEVCDLSVSYGQHKALEGASLSVSPGEIVVILGANGAGKSTLLKALSGICEGQVSGGFSLSGHPLDGLSADQIVEEGIAQVPEGRGIFGDLTVEDNLKLGAFPNRAQGDEAANLDRVFALFPKLTERRRQIARTMSGGEQQMVAIGRAMMSSPRILTLDEPSLGLSPLLCKELFQNLRAVRALGIGILMVEQNAKQSLAIADRGYLLENTKIIHEDSADALMHDPAVQAAYLGAGASASGSASSAAAPAQASGTRPAQSDGQAADKTRPGVAPVAPGTPPPVAIKPASRARPSADSLAGVNLGDLVASADRRAKSAPRPDTANAPPTAQGARPDLSGSPDIQAMLKEFEIAAARAGKARPMPSYSPRRAAPPGPKGTSVQTPQVSTPGANTTGARTTGARTSGAKAPEANNQEAQEPPVTIEVYRAPRVEVYRRRPGGKTFDRE